MFKLHFRKQICLVKTKTQEEASASLMLLEVLPILGVASDSSSNSNSPRTPHSAVVLVASRTKEPLCSEVKLSKTQASEALHQVVLGNQLKESQDKPRPALEEQALGLLEVSNRAHSQASEELTMLVEEGCLVEINKSPLVADFLVRHHKVLLAFHLVSNQINLRDLVDSQIKPLVEDCLELTNSSQE